MRLAQIMTLIFGILATGPALAARAPILEQILSDVRESYAKQERPMVIFDVDGTLLDNRPRILKILTEYADQELMKVRPDEAKLVKALGVTDVQYRISDTFRGIGITDAAIINNATVFWSERFFSDEYLNYDTPTPGVVDYVRTLYSTGAKIVYLTGRDTERQLLGTVRALRAYGFPVGIQGTELIMKPTAGTQNAMFKQRVTNYLRHYGLVVATFDNEPANINVYRRAFGNSLSVLFEAPHSANPPPLLPGVVKLSSFEPLVTTTVAPINIVEPPTSEATQETPSPEPETIPASAPSAEANVAGDPLGVD